jgi:hypothetical protein
MSSVKLQNSGTSCIKYLEFSVSANIELPSSAQIYTGWFILVVFCRAGPVVSYGEQVMRVTNLKEIPGMSWIHSLPSLGYQSSIRSLSTQWKIFKKIMFNSSTS